MKKRKYKNEPTYVDGIRFDSKRESARYGELRDMAKAGLITDLQLQVPFILREGFRDETGYKHRAMKYVADFTYYQDGEYIVEDVKSKITAQDKVYKIKKRLMLQDKGIRISEVIR